MTVPPYEASFPAWAVVLSISLFFSILEPFVSFLDSRLRSCAHGVRGARANLSKCEHCVTELVERERQAELAKEEKIRAQKRADAEWKAQIRQGEYLRTMHPSEFEKLVCSLYRKLGYEVRSTRYSSDNGIDGVLIKDNRKGILQCKRIKGAIGEPILRDLLGTITKERASFGVAVTTGSVSRQAKAWVKDQPIQIVELDALVKMIRSAFPEDEVIPRRFPTSDGPHPRRACPYCKKPMRLFSSHAGMFWECTESQCRGV